MSQSKELLCFTIGHSIHPLSKFLKFLAAYNINCIIDVRSIPYLKYAAQYNRDYLESELKQKGIRYWFMGDILGTKYQNADLNPVRSLLPEENHFPMSDGTSRKGTSNGVKSEDGTIDYTKVRKTKSFEEGVGQIIDEIKKGAVIAIMCSEKEPFLCHRFISISHSLSIQGITVQHILKDGSLCSQEELEDKMLMQYKPDYEQTTKQEALEQAYFEHGKNIACDSK